MSNLFLIDGFNLFHQWGVTRDIFMEMENPASAVGKAVPLLARDLGLLKRRCIVALDGGLRSGPETRCGLRLQYSGGQSNADTLILNMLRTDKTPSRYTVVTSDRSLGGGAIALGAQALPVERFLEDHLSGAAASPAADTPEKHRTPDSEEVDEYLRLFGDGSDILEEPGE